MMIIIVDQWTYSKAWQQPSKSTKDQGLNKANDVQKFPAFGMNAVASKEYGDGAIDGDAQRENEEPTPNWKEMNI